MPVVNTVYEKMPSFAEAAKQAGQGYLNQALLAELHSSWFYVGEPRLTDLPDFFGPFFAAVAASHIAHPVKILRVIDFGGTVGRYKAYVDAYFSGQVKTGWSVVETPLYADYARSHATDGVEVVTSIDAVTAGDIDFVFLSGVLQYVDEWRAVLDHPRIQNAEHIFITRTPLGSEESSFLQTVEYTSGTVKIPARIIKASDLMDNMKRTHHLFASSSLSQHLGVIGTGEAPSMLWRVNSTRQR